MRSRATPPTEERVFIHWTELRMPRFESYAMSLIELGRAWALGDGAAHTRALGRALDRAYRECWP